MMKDCKEKLKETRRKLSEMAARIAKDKEAEDEQKYESIIRDQAALAALPACMEIVNAEYGESEADVDCDRLAVNDAFDIADEFILRRRTKTGYIEQIVTRAAGVERQADVDPDCCYKCKRTESEAEQSEMFDIIYKDGLSVPVCNDCNRVLRCPICKATIPSDLKTDKLDTFGNPCCPKCFPPADGLTYSGMDLGASPSIGILTCNICKASFDIASEEMQGAKKDAAGNICCPKCFPPEGVVGNPNVAVCAECGAKSPPAVLYLDGDCDDNARHICSKCGG